MNNTGTTGLPYPLESNNKEEALTAFRRLMSIPEYRDDANFWFHYGKLLWSLDKRTEAESAYRHAVELDPDSPAQIALEMCQEISSFFNPDLLNP